MYPCLLPAPIPLTGYGKDCLWWSKQILFFKLPHLSWREFNLFIWAKCLPLPGNSPLPFRRDLNFGRYKYSNWCATRLLRITCSRGRSDHCIIRIRVLYVVSRVIDWWLTEIHSAKNRKQKGANRELRPWNEVGWLRRKPSKCSTSYNTFTVQPPPSSMQHVACAVS